MLAKTILIVFILVFNTNSYSANKIFTKNGLAIDGYDPVAYHKKQQAIKGNTSISFVWQETNWIFTSIENRDTFAKAPKRYAPQYGGFCAYAMSQGSFAPTTPHAWTLYQDKLYLNYSLGVQKLWRQDKDKFIKRADRHWREQN